MTEPLQEAFYETERARLQRWLPWVHLFRAFRLATRWQNLALALLGTLLLAGGRWGLSYAPFAGHSGGEAALTVGPVTLAGNTARANRRTVWPWERVFLSPQLPATRQSLEVGATPDPRTLLVPLADLVQPASRLFVRRSSWGHIADAWLQMLLVLAVGGFIGGAIARRVALEFGAMREIGLRESLRWGCGEASYTVSAPLICVVGVGVLLGVGRLIAWIGRVPAVGETAAAVLWGLLLLFALVLALMLIGVAVAWPLMVAAHSCEGTDSFDALNRAYNYVFVRPWYALWLAVVALAYGTLVLAFLLWLVGLTVHLSEWIAAGPLSDEALRRITLAAPPLVESGSLTGMGADATLAGRIGGVWQRGLAAVLTAFVYSFFWTSATLIYLLLRKSVDACDLNRIYLPKPAPPDGPPLAGMAAVERREQQIRAESGATASPAEAPVPEASS